MIGKLIAIEGIDGCGKSTLVKYVHDGLQRDGCQVVSLAAREPDKDQVFETMVKEYSLDPKSPAYMFFFQMLHAHKADRTKKALKEGKIVVADRWDLSFFVYHDNFGFFSRESPELREGVSRLAFGGVQPDLGIYLDVSVDEAFDRRMWRGEIIQDIEAEREFYTKITASYKSLAQRYNWIILDANDHFEQVRKRTWELVQELLK